MIGAFGPIWILTALGYAIRRAGLLDEAAAAVLGRFVFHLAMPAALYLTLSRLPLSGFAGPSLLAFAASTGTVIGLGWLAARRLLHRPPGDGVIWGMAAGYVNSANLGIPIATRVLGDVSFLVEVVLVQSLLVTPVILLALDRAADPDRRIRVRRLLTMPLRNPVILGVAFGVLASATGFRAPGVLADSLSLLSAAAVPAALVALGASLHRQPGRSRSREAAAESAGSAAESAGSAAVASPERGYGELGATTVAKLAVQPLVAWLAGLALRLPGPELLAVVVCAGLPTAQNTFIFATEYRVAEALSSRAVIATTAFSLATLAAIAALLG
ncbi:AEC family transporter [Plantactinospora siamensis]|uniref:AEC family transporter n=1 Tax=Plantactinospora siamensis TaxID=555372 RepID=A0ABV6P121_9ACTN